MIVKYTIKLNDNVSVYIDNEHFLKDLYKYVHSEYNYYPINQMLGGKINIEVEFLDVEEHFGSPFIAEESTIDIFGECFESYQKRMQANVLVDEMNDEYYGVM